MTSTLFIIGSPFQGLCMLEAIERFRISEFDVMVLEVASGSGTEQTKTLLKDNKIPYITYNVHHAIFELIPFVLKKHKHYKNIFIGNYYNPTDEGIAAFYGRKHYSLYFLDDGLQALSLFSENPRNRYESKKWEYWFKIYDAIGWLKGRQKPHFFTIFDVKSDRYVIVKNEFKQLRNNISPQKRGCYIIGTNSTIVKFKDYSYRNLMEVLVKKLQNLYPEEKVYYCPHRRDQNNDLIYEWCLKNYVEWFDTRVSVEYDFVKNELNPLCIVGFTSNALYTLKMIYPDGDISTVFYRCLPDSYDDEINAIRQKMNDNGIGTFYLY